MATAGIESPNGSLHCWLAIRGIFPHPIHKTVSQKIDFMQNKQTLVGAFKKIEYSFFISLVVFV